MEILTTLFYFMMGALAGCGFAAYHEDQRRELARQARERGGWPKAPKPWPPPPPVKPTDAESEVN